MRRALAVALAWTVLAAAGGGTGLVVATYNVENYTAADRLIPDGYRRAYPKTEAAKAALRRVIRGLDADVLVLQEMGPRPYLDELQRDLRAEGVDYPVAHLLEAADADRHVAVLARRPFRTVRPHADVTFRLAGATETVKRGVLELVVPAAGGDVTIWALHLKSRYTDRTDDPDSARRRGGEARAIRDLVLAASGDPATARFLVLGDCNDGPRSATVRYLTEKGGRPVARLLPAADSRGERWTYAYNRTDTYEGIDHILVSLALLRAVRDGGAVIADGPDTLVASDHRPVVVALDLDSGEQRADPGAEAQHERAE